MLDLKNRQTGLKYEKMVEGGRGVGDDAQRARRNSPVHIAVAVGRTALHGHKDRAGQHTTGVVLDAGYGLLGVPASAYGSNFVDEFFPQHLVVHCRA